MRIRRSLAAALTVLGVLGLSAVRAQKDDAKPEAPRRLDPDVVSVRLLLGIGDPQTRTWSGKVAIDQGEVLGVEGYRFRKGDKVVGRDAWEAQSHLIRKAAPKKAQVKAALAAQPQAKTTGPGTVGPTVVPNGVIVSLKAPSDATLSVETERGTFQVALASLADGSARRFLDGQAEVQRVPTSVALRDGDDHEDFPAAAADRQGALWIASVEHQPRGEDVLESYQSRPKDFANLVPKGGGDQIRLLRFADGQAGVPLDVTTPGRDVWRPSVAVDGNGGIVVAWSENVEGNWDLYRRRYDPMMREWSEPKRLTDQPGSDLDVVLATAPDGSVWMAWQGWRDGNATVYVSPVEDAARIQPVSTGGSNAWSPALAIDKNGIVVVAYDTYEKGNYDVRLLKWDPKMNVGKGVAIADSSKYETRPSVALDARGRAWVAFEERDDHWGKDAENLVEGKGSSLYRSAAVRVRCVDGNKVFDAPDPLAAAPEGIKKLNSYPRLTVDRSGRVWLAFRHRQEAVWGGNAVLVCGGVWVEYVTSLAGKAWEVPLFVPRSDGLLDNRPALVAPGDGPVLAVYSTDGRLRREVEFTPELSRRYWAHSGTPGGVARVFNEDLMIAALTPSQTPATVDPVAETPYVLDGARDLAPPVHPTEDADVARLRTYRIDAGGKNYRLLRGDFHRHTEVSQDGGSDGSLEDMWRYAIDAARLDWMGNADHDNGGGKEYTWWLVQKTTDFYQHAGFPTLFTYERSVPYPHGHRNVMFPRRGVRTLPRLVDETGAVVDDDTKMLYDYLKELGGLCASHTSGTGMGTDWRDVDPTYEPIVEIFQGHRNSYEALGAPRVARRPNEAIGGWKPLGMVWNALGMQYRFGYQASSDHISTHISFAVAIAEDATRAAVFDAFKRRHCYGATDNILLDVRSGAHLMGDEFDADGPVTLKVLAHGTGPIARVDIIKDFKYVFSTEPNKPRVELSWTDDEKRPGGLSWYYVRVLQEDGEIAWGSPFWVHGKGNADVK